MTSGWKEGAGVRSHDSRDDSELRFDGQVAVITGSGRGIGREEALLLAERGATVVVHDLEEAWVDETARLIEHSGGVAVRCVSDVQTPDGAAEPVRVALRGLDRVDVLINNVGFAQDRPFLQWQEADVERMFRVHFSSAFWATQAAWPSMTERGYGRVIMTGSISQWGMPNTSPYTSAKAALWGLTRVLAVEGKSDGVLVNQYAPAAYTDLIRDEVSSAAIRAWMSEKMPAWAAAQPIGWLAHPQCDANGQFFASHGRYFSRYMFAETEGWLGEVDYSPESIRDHFTDASDPEGAVEHTSTPDALDRLAGILDRIAEPRSGQE